ncbi:Meiosis protein Mei1 [Lasiodiplodia theobromae]|uniref:Meiosis protein Mei1 n=1 Tax=Lasiodiplodia theobromae TaxID=45133 RepID=UPI0015C31B33|nr:Meiosis protein Mei1 [Lasiodiplodia theobromae]KAF4543573.1 Meiosis protein Mei1 [Lasiodiplodia theobromae]
MPASTFLGSGSSSSPPFSVPGQSDVGPPVFPEVAPHQLAPDTETTTLHALVRTLSDQSNAKFSTDSASGPTRYKDAAFFHATKMMELPSDAVVFEFDQLSQAEAALQAKNELDSEGHARFIKVAEYGHLLRSSHPSKQVFNKFEGQIIVHITHDREDFGETVETPEPYFAMLAWMDQWLGSDSQRAVVCTGLTANAVGYGIQFRMELDSLSFTDYLVNGWSAPRKIKDHDFFAQVEPFQPVGYEPMPVVQRGGPSYQRFIQRGNVPGAMQLQVYVPGGPVQPHRERGYSGPRRSSFGSGRRDDQNNAIDVEKIRRGLDVRTTVMLRNIPNQMTTYDLQALLNTWVRGKFDFLYLRIDFANMCNVGYAFVNFDMPMTIVEVKQKLDAHGWPGHLGSTKRAAMSYATVQGVESLVEKFRNSSVMLELPNCRPRLFWTFQDFPDPLLLPLVGSEKEFPKSNNEAKLARSRQNAETQGLYPAHSRDEFRHNYTHSQFDRGNPNGLYSAGRANYY